VLKYCFLLGWDFTKCWTSLNDVSQVIGIMVVIMGIGLIIDGIVFKRLETKVMSRWGLG